MAFVLGLDVSTTATKAILVDEDGSVYGVLTTADVDRAFRETRQ